MSLSSFAIAFLGYMLITKFFGKESSVARFAQVILVPAIIVAYDFIVITAPADYQYLLGCLPLAGIAGLFFYSYFRKKTTPLELVEEKKVPVVHDEPKKLSKKSERIHAKRKARGRE